MGHSDLQEYSAILLNVYGGCCSNAFSLETLMSQNPTLGSALTFCQLIFIAVQSLPSFILLNPDPNSTFSIRLRPRKVPLYLWMACVLLLTGVSLLNNWAFAYQVPVAIQILIRSAGLGVAMCIGFFFMNKRYVRLQVLAVVMVTVGVVLATLSKPIPKRKPSPTTLIRTASQYEEAASLYSVGVAMLVLGLLLSGVLGALQERIFQKYGPHWEESVFYTHALSIPFFSFLFPEVLAGFRTSFTPLYDATNGLHTKAVAGLCFLALNLLTQNICVRGVNRLTTRMSSVSANLILTGRKAASLCLSVWFFSEDGWNAGMAAGAAMVFFGSALYGIAGKPSANDKSELSASSNGNAAKTKKIQ